MRIDGVGVPYDGSVTYDKMSNPDSFFAGSMARQMIINGNMSISQRGTSFNNPATGSYTLDRYGIYNTVSANPGALSHGQAVLTPGELSGSMNAYHISSGGNLTPPSGAQAYFISQNIENGTRYFCKANQKITLSFYARATMTNKKIGVNLAQFYGTGGSGATTDYPGTYFDLTTDWQKFSYTFTTQDITGKTIAADDFLQLRIALAWGPSWNVNFGVSPEAWGFAGDIYFTQVQLSEGETVLPFPQEFYHDELEKCRRYFQHFYTTSTLSDYFIGMTDSVAAGARVPVKLPVKMRILPTITVIDYGNWLVEYLGNISSPTAISGQASNDESILLSVQANGLSASSVCTVTSPNGTNRVYLELNAEW